MSKKQREDLKKLLARALNNNQLLILSEIERNSRTITSILINLSRKTKIPLSTLKFNAKILRQLELIAFTDFSNAELTNFGRFVFVTVGGENPR